MLDLIRRLVLDGLPDFLSKHAEDKSADTAFKGPDAHAAAADAHDKAAAAQRSAGNFGKAKEHAAKAEDHKAEAAKALPFSQDPAAPPPASPAAPAAPAFKDPHEKDHEAGASKVAAIPRDTSGRG